MITLAALALSVALPSTAHAKAGFGTSYGFGAASNQIGATLFPSLDLHLEGATIQLYPLEFLSFAAADQMYLGANFFMPMHMQGGVGGWSAKAEGGVSLDVLADSSAIGVLALCRVGMEHSSGAGVYIVPGVGMSYAYETVSLATEGRLELSYWFPRR